MTESSDIPVLLRRLRFWRRTCAVMGAVLAAAVVCGCILRARVAEAETALERYTEIWQEGIEIELPEKTVSSGGLTVRRSENGLAGLADSVGAWRVRPEYSNISLIERGFWVLAKELDDSGLCDYVVCDSNLSTVLEGRFRGVSSYDDSVIICSMPDHSDAVYGYDGHRRNVFYCKESFTPDYATGTTDAEGREIYEEAALMVYVTTDYHMGLMTPAGRVVTPPRYTDIKPVNRFLYFCEYPEESGGVLLDAEGRPVESQ